LRRLNILSATESVPPIVLPSKLVTPVIEWCHADSLSGHLKYQKTYRKVRDRYWFPLMHQRIYEFCRSCEPCQLKDKVTLPKIRAKALTSEGPMIVVHGNSTKASTTIIRGNTHILTLVDHFSRYIKAYPIGQPCASVIADCMFDYVCNFGVPVTFKLDNDS
jgi:Integrase zinc binding domain